MQLQDLHKRRILIRKVAPPPPQPPVRPTTTPPPPNTTAARKELAELLTQQNHLVEKLVAGAGKTQAISDFNAIRDPKKRYEQACEFRDALREVDPLYSHYKRLSEEVATAHGVALQREQAKQPLDEAGSSAAWAKLGTAITVQKMLLREDGIPGSYAVPNEGPWPQALIRQLTPFTQGDSAEDNERLRQEVRDNSPTKEQKEDATKAGEALKNATLKYQVRGLERSSVFFDAGRNGVPISPEDMKLAAEATATLVRMGCDILDNGGSYAKVQELMKASGLPEESWPPQLVQSVQAWRKTQRALTQERVRALFAKPAKGLPESPVERSTIDAVTSVFKDSGELSEALEEIRKQAEEARKATEEATSGGSDVSDTVEHASDATEALTAAALVNGIGSGVDGLLGLMQAIQGAKEFYEAASDSELPNRERALKMLGASLETLGGLARSAKDGLQMAKDFGPEPLKQHLAKIIPGLGIAVAAIELAQATKELAESVDSLNKASALKRDALASFSRDDGDEAAVNVFANDKSGAKIRVAKNSVETGTSAIELTGAIATTAGGSHGAAAGAALSIAAGAIKLGSKVVFAGIDWSAAKKAMQTIRDAQAGSYQAQVEVFEDSNFYAKMYLAIMVKEGNPMAQKYLVNQGMEEDDLDDPTSLGLLRDAMLENAEQSNDLEAEDTLIGKMMGLGGKIVDGVRELTLEDLAKGAGTFVLAGGVLAPLTLTLADFARKAATPTYDPEAKYTVAGFVSPDVDTWPHTWEEAKKAHIEHGLVNDATGLGAILEKAVKADEAAGTQAKLPTDQDERVKAVRQALLDAIAATRAVLELAGKVQLQAYQPGMGLPRKVPHQQAFQSLQSLRAAANAVTDIYWKRYDDMPPERPEWVAPAIGKIEPGAWNGFWTAGQAEAGFPADDAGVAKAIKTANEARAAFEKETEGKKKRQLVLAYVATLDDLNDAALEALGIEEVNRRKSARVAIDQFMLLLNKERRTLDEHLADATGGGVLPPWKSPAKAFETLQPSDYLAEWKKTWNYAVKEGFAAGSDDAGLTDALAQFQGYCDDLENSVGKPKEHLKAVRSMEVGAGRIKKHAIEFGRKQRYAVDPLKAYATSVRTTVVDRTTRQVEETEKNANAVEFEDKPTKKPEYLSSIDWRTVCADAVEKGAVLESATATKKLSAALKTAKEKRLAYEKARDEKKPSGKSVRALADAYLEALHTVEGDVAMTLGLKRYDKNTRMSGYLNGISTAVEAQKKDKVFVGYLEGESEVAKKVAFDTAKLSASNWSSNKKKAVDSGIITTKKTGVKEAIEDLLKVKTTAVAEKKEKRESLLALLKEMKALSKHPGWVTYCGGLIQEATNLA